MSINDICALVSDTVIVVVQYSCEVIVVAENLAKICLPRDAIDHSLYDDV